MDVCTGFVCGVWCRAAETGNRGVQETDPGTARTFWETEGHSGQTNPPSAQTTGTKGLHYQSKVAEY